MLSRTARLSVDRLWDTAWANGITNPLTCVEVLTVVLLARTCDPLRTAIERRDAAAIEREVDALHAAAGVALGTAAGRLLARHTDLAVDLLERADQIDHADGDDVLGDVFEHLLACMATAGHFGQFRTPRHLISFVIDLVDPQPDETVLDPACGTGGFLIGAARHGVSADRLRGEEIDGSLSRLAQLNAVAHDLRDASIVTTDGLTEHASSKVILANPPFGGSVRAEVARRFTSSSSKTELLFLEHLMDRLEDGGRAGVIVPWGVIANRTQGADAIRRRLLDTNDLRAVIELPSGAFRPYTDSRTAVLLWYGGGKSDAVFVGRARADGFSLDDKRDPVDDNDLPGLVDAFRGGARDGGVVDASELRADGYLLVPGRHRSQTARPRSAPGVLVASVAALAPVVNEITDAIGVLSAAHTEQDTRATERSTSSEKTDKADKTDKTDTTDDKEAKRARARFGPPMPGTLGELVLFCTAAVDADEIDPTMPYVGLEHLDVETGGWRWVPAGSAGVRSPKGVFRAGDVLYGRLRPNLRKCCVATVDGTCSADIFVLRPHDVRLGPLLALFLRSTAFAARASELATGANLPRVAARDLLATPLVLPPEPERSRLVSMAEAAERARRATSALDASMGAVEEAIAGELTAAHVVRDEGAR